VDEVKQMLLLNGTMNIRNTMKVRLNYFSKGPVTKVKFYWGPSTPIISYKALFVVLLMGEIAFCTSSYQFLGFWFTVVVKIFICYLCRWETCSLWSLYFIMGARSS